MYDDKVVVKSMNFETGNWIPRAEYVIPFIGNEFIGDVSIAFGNLNVASTLTAKLNGEAVGDGYSCEWYIDGVSVGTGDTYSVVTADKNVSVKVKAADGSYAWASTNVFDYVPESETPDTPATPDDDPIPDFNGNDAVKYSGSIITLNGQVDAAYAGKNIVLVIAPKASYTKPETIKYINECTVKADGTYKLKFMADNVSGDDFIMTKLQGENVTNSIISLRGENDSDIDFDMILNNENKPVITIKNNYLDKTSSKLVIATYNENGALISAKSVDFDIDFGASLDVQQYVDDMAVSGHSVKAFVWDSLRGMKPIADTVMKLIEIKS